MAKKSPLTPTNIAHAVRESGHAVVAWQQQVTLMPMTMRDARKGTGCNVWNDAIRNVDFEWVENEDSRALVERLAMVLIAGPVAQRLLAPRSKRGPVFKERLAEARRLLKAVDGDKGFKKHWDDTMAGVESFFRRKRVSEAVHTLSRRLLDEGSVAGGVAAREFANSLDSDT